MHVFFLYATFVVLTHIDVQAAQKRFELVIENVSCQSLTNHLKHFECTYQKVANGKYLINSKLMSDIKLDKELDMHLRVRVTPWEGKTSFNFLDLRVNVCAITSQVFSKSLLQTVFNELIRTSNLPWICPFKANFVYKVDNYSVTEDVIPAYAPFMNATYSVNFLRYNQPFADYSVFFALIPMNNKNVKT